MQDKLLEAMAGLGSILVEFEKQQQILDPVLLEIQQHAKDSKEPLFDRYNTEMANLNAKKEELEALKQSLNEHNGNR